MGITFVKGGDIFDYEEDGALLINPVNTEGVSGCGLAKAFRIRYPSMFNAYRNACSPTFPGVRFDVGTLLVIPVENQEKACSFSICCFPTKKAWRNPSQYCYVEMGLIKLAAMLKEHGDYTKVVIPMLGCGAGLLDRDRVLGLMTKRLSDVALDIVILTG